MLTGRFDQAWRESDNIAAFAAPDPNRFWDGSPFRGNRVIIRCLHGFGDTIQFIRYARSLRRDAARIIVETHPEMVSVLQCALDVDEVITWAKTPAAGYPEWDQQIEIVELPRAFRTTLETIPRHVPYIRVGDDAIERSRRNLGVSGKPRVGILWRASNWNPARSVPLIELTDVLNVRDVSFYSFQRDEGRGELDGLQSQYGIHDTAQHSPDIADTAADLMNMDLLLTVDTMAAHLAGALGKPVWVMLPFEADWRWMLDRIDSPWYPTMRLFRQPEPGDWRAVVRCVAGELLRLFS